MVRTGLFVIPIKTTASLARVPRVGEERDSQNAIETINATANSVTYFVRRVSESWEVAIG